MSERTIHILRKTLTVVCMILVFTTVCLLSIATQIKTITLNYYGNKVTVRTVAASVDSFLLQNKIYVGDDTDVLPGKNEKIVDNMEIVISSEKELAKIDIDSMKNDYIPMVAKFEEVVESIPYSEETKDNPEIDKGVTQTVQEGVEGQKITSYIVRYSGDKEIDREQIDSEVLAEAQNRVVEVGTRVTVSRSSIVNSVVSAPVDGGFRQYNISLPVEQQQYAYNLCKRYGIDYELFLAIMYKESRFNPNAFGGNNSYGICQIHISNHESLKAKLGISDFFDPYDNMTAGAYLFSSYMAAANSKISDYNTAMVYALNSYNMGEGIYYKNYYSQGRIDREYSTSILNIRNQIISNGGI